MLVSAKEMWLDAKKNGYAVCAPNILSIETARLCIEAAEEMKAPVILGAGYHGPCDDYLKRRPLNNLVRAIELEALPARVPVAIHQDHGRNYETALACIAAGYTSIMVDRSTLSFDENVAQVAELVKIAHTVGVSVEAELGHVGHSGDDPNDEANLTNPEDAAKFVELTGVDALAVAIGTVHGEYKGTPHIDFERLDKITELTNIPLVLHGGSGTGDENLSRAAKSGISKVNVMHALVWAAEAAEAKEERPFFKRQAYNQGYKDAIKHHMEVFGSANRV